MSEIWKCVCCPSQCEVLIDTNTGPPKASCATWFQIDEHTTASGKTYNGAAVDQQRNRGIPTMGKVKAYNGTIQAREIIKGEDKKMYGNKLTYRNKDPFDLSGFNWDDDFLPLWALYRHRLYVTVTTHNKMCHSFIRRFVFLFSPTWYLNKYGEKYKV
jgi:hypothetical protein